MSPVDVVRKALANPDVLSDVGTMVDLAGRAFAVSEMLSSRLPDRGRTARPLTGPLESHLERLRTITIWSDEELYEELLHVACSIEERLTRAPYYGLVDDLLPDHIDIAPCDTFPDGCVLQCAWSGPSILRAHLNRAREEGGRRRILQAPAHHTQLVHLWFAPQQVGALTLQMASPHPEPFDPTARIEAAIHAASPPFAVALAWLPEVFTARFAVADTGATFAVDEAQPMVQPKQLEAAVLAALHAALADPGIGVLVFPELGVPDSLHESIRLSLRQASPDRMLAVCAGSWHVMCGPGQRHNRSSTFGRGPNPWSIANKGAAFRLLAPQVEAMHRQGVFAAPPSCLQPEVYESHEPGTRLQLLAMPPLGRIATVVCADLIDASDTFVPHLIAARPDLVLVPSCSTKTELFAHAQNRLARAGIASCMVNADWACREGQDLAAVELPWHVRSDDPPVHVRVRKGGGVEMATLGEPRTTEISESGPVRWLGPELGVVDELGGHWQDTQ